MRRWFTALGVVFTCLLFTVGASSSGTRAASTTHDAPMLLAATEASAQPTVVAAPSPQSVAAEFGAYAVVGLETIIATALLCYAVLQRRRATNAPLLPCVIRLRGPPNTRDLIALAP